MERERKAADKCFGATSPQPKPRQHSTDGGPLGPPRALAFQERRLLTRWVSRRLDARHERPPRRDGRGAPACARPRARPCLTGSRRLGAPRMIEDRERSSARSAVIQKGPSAPDRNYHQAIERLALRVAKKEPFPRASATVFDYSSRPVNRFRALANCARLVRLPSSPRACARPRPTRPQSSRRSSVRVRRPGSAESQLPPSGPADQNEVPCCRALRSARSTTDNIPAGNP